MSSAFSFSHVKEICNLETFGSIFNQAEPRRSLHPFFVPPVSWVKMSLMIYKASLGSTDAPGSCCGSGLPSQPSTVSPPAGWGLTGRLQGGKMAEQKAESACFFSLSSSANESIDVASGPRPSFSQTTDTNRQHVSWFTNQTSSLDWEAHLDSLSRICVGKRQMRDAAAIKSLSVVQWK